MKIIGLALAIVLLSSPLALAEVYLSAEEATKRLFPNLQEYKVEKRTVDNQEFKILIVVGDDKVMGWTVVVSEMGKIKPITFLVGIDTQGKILGVYVLEYRDIFGSEIRRRSFLRQFLDKSVKDSLTVGRDIDAVTGATISSQAATSAVRKSIQIIEELQKGDSHAKPMVQH